MNSFFIIKTSAIGDVIQTFPVLEYLRRKFPSSRIDWLVEKNCSALVASHPMVSRVVSVDAKGWKKKMFSRQTRQEIQEYRSSMKQVKYDVVFDFQANTKSGFLSSCVQAEKKVGFDSKGVAEWPNLLFTTDRFSRREEENIRSQYLGLVKSFFSEQEEEFFSPIRLKITEQEEMRKSEWIGSLQKKPLRLMITFGSKWPNKQLSFDLWKGFLEEIAKQWDVYFFFVFGGVEERGFAEKLSSFFPETSQCIGDMSLPFWQSLMYEMDGVLSVDSAALHLCGTTTTPSFSIFGPSLSSVYRPLGMQHCSIQGECPYGMRFSSRCPILRSCKLPRCMRDLRVEQLMRRFSVWADENLTSRVSN